MHFPFKRRWSWLLLIGMAVPVLAVILAGLPRRLPPAVCLLQRPFSAPLLFRDRIFRWLPNGKGWNWAQSIVYSGRKVINLDAEVFNLSEVPAIGQFGAPVFTNPTGTQVWFLTPNKIKAFRGQIRQLAGANDVVTSRVSTCDGITATLFSGQTIILDGSTNQVGLETSFYTRTERERTDLWLSAFYSEMATNDLDKSPGQIVMVVTNLDVAARLQVPRGNGLILISRADNSGTNRYSGIVLDPF